VPMIWFGSPELALFACKCFLRGWRSRLIAELKQVRRELRAVERALAAKIGDSK
jgi:hypothetical protein